ncbi:DnaJ-domain-containing protein [Ceraceosorus guamensis]|uniref:DnaJ-domain-containing protein n=1 Tax=Ceraceosorus guamensis TaxID=1522189 RepID=A0A316W8I9_9BASI|nr:DnaJ-domain-containing protein [Ceraceosorus guamensis]PWN45071.1 DnaJ-domain-containing protein [Ceraceosorus guamensis]
MFVASSLYNYARGSNAAGAATVHSDHESTPAATRVKRHPKKTPGAPPNGLPTSPPPSYASVAAGLARAGGVTEQEGGKPAWTPAELAKISVIDGIAEEEDLYKVLGIRKTAKQDEVRRGFLARSRVCHPDKMPSYPPCHAAFQRVALAYQTLSSPSARRMYDVSGRADYAQAMDASSHAAANGAGDETLNSVLYSVFCEFLEGDFEMIRVLVNAMNEGNPGLNLGEEAVDSIEGAFRRLRHMMLAGKRYLGVIRFELIRLYEIQHSLRQLSYFDLFGRLRLTLQLARVTLSIPMAIDTAMKTGEPGEDASGVGSQGQRTGRDGRDAGRSETNEFASDEDSEDDESDVEEMHDGRSRRRNADQFGVASSSDESGGSDADARRGSSQSQRREARQARRRERRKQRRARRARLESHNDEADQEPEMVEGQLQRSGLLGPTAATLLGGVVKVLETSESWVPGGSRQAQQD